MAETIKGINVVIGSETTGLQAALKNVNKEGAKVKEELKQVERLLKLDPTNTELVAQKQKLLSDAVSTTREKLDKLRAAQEQVNQQLAKGQISEGQYRAFQREIAKAEQELSSFENQLQETGSTAKKTGRDVDALGNDLKGLGDKVKGVGETLSVGVTAPIVGAFALATEGTRELRGDLGTLETNAKMVSQSMEEINAAMTKMYAVTGETDSNVEGLSNILAAGFKDEKLTELVDALAGASIKFKDTLKFEGISDGLQETLATGAAIGPFAELLDRSSISLDTFNAGLKEAKKNGTEQEYVLEVLAQAGLPAVYEEYRKTNQGMVEAAESQYNLQTAMAELGKTLEPILTPIITKITEFIGKFNEMSPAGQKVVMAVGGIAAAIGPALIVIGQIASAVGALSGLFGGAGTAAGSAGAASTGLGTALAAVAGPVAAVVAVIVGLIATVKHLWETNEEFRNTVTEIWEDIRKLVADVVNGIMVLWDRWGEDIKAVLSVIWDDIKAIFEGAVQVIVNVFGLFIDILTGDWEGAWEHLKNIFSAIWETIKTVITNAFKGLEALGQLLYDIGKTIIEGLINGIKERIEKVKQVISDLASAITGKIKSALDIQSPSKVMHEIGENVSQGLADGIESGKEEVKKSVSEVIAELVDMRNEIQEISDAANEDLIEAEKDHSEDVLKVIQERNESIIAAENDLVEKEQAIKDQLAQQEQQLTDQYEQQLNSRIDALENFVGLFDQVTSKEVSGSQLLANLQGQVKTFEEWQQNITALGAKGIDEGLLDQLREMGPSAAPEVAALTTLTEQELQLYVELWKQKQEMAKTEATSQLVQQKEEMNQKLIEIRADAQSQLEQQRIETAQKIEEIRVKAQEELEKYRLEWQKKQEEIRKNAEEQVKTIKERYQELEEQATVYGSNIISNLIAGIRSRMSALAQVMDEVKSITSDGMDPTVRHSPSLVDRIQTGVGQIYEAWKTLLADLKGLDLANGLNAIAPAVAGSMSNTSTAVSNSSTTNHYGGNTIVIQVTDGWDQIERELRKRGVDV